MNLSRFSILAFCTLLNGTLSGSLQAETAPPTATAEKSTKDLLEQIRKDARDDFQRAADALRRLRPERMNAEDRATWVRLSRETAIRNGDAATLSALKGEPDPFALLPLSRILLANGYLNEANFSAARAELDGLGDLKRINTRDQRRYWALRARLAQLENKPAEERAALEHIVHELAHWQTGDCQSCHNDLKNLEALPLLEFQNTWYARRFVELMQKQGDAQAVRRQSEQRLAKKPDDLDARILLGFALLAQGKQRDADTCWGEIPWIALPGRKSVATTRMMFAWP